MANREPLAQNEWYHCYSRGVDKRKTFKTTQDYERFVQLLYLLNSSTTTHRSDLGFVKTADILKRRRGAPLVAIGAYCLMSNHIHLLLKQQATKGISRFMRTLGISYAMYFNIKYERSGNLFVRPFRSKHVSDDRYFQYVAQYIHLNPAEIFEPGWKDGIVKDRVRLEKNILGYRYSSFQDYLHIDRPERKILDAEAYESLREGLPSLSSVISAAAEYYRTVKMTS